MTVRTYSSPEAFKQALDQRLRSAAKTGAGFARKRQLLVFDRFLARIFAVFGDAAILKGGLVLELRIERARTTKDVDLGMVGSPDSVLSAMAHEDQLAWPTLDEVTMAARRFLDPVLAGPLDATWEPRRWDWSRPGGAE